MKKNNCFNDSEKKTTRHKTKVNVEFILLFFSLAVFGCANTAKQGTMPNTSKDALIYIAQPCETLETDNDGAERKIDGIFIEVAWDINSVIPDSGGDWFAQHKVAANSTGGATVKNFTPYAFKIGNSNSSTNEFSLVVTPSFKDNQNKEISISVKITKGKKQETILDEKTVVTTHQNAIVVELDGGSSAGDFSPLVITPYLLSGDASMQKLMECRMSKSVSERKQMKE